MGIIKTAAYKGNKSVSTLGGNVRMDEAKGQFIAFNGENNLGLFGFDSEGRVAVKIAKEGFDADTATDDQLIFNSGQNIFKIIDSDSFDAEINFGSTSGPTQGGDYAEFRVTHDLGFKPAFLAFRENSQGRFIPFNQNSVQMIGVGTWQSFQTEAFSTETELIFIIQRPYVLASGSTMPALNVTNKVTYYILQESLS